jgi:hypothetical protein
LWDFCNGPAFFTSVMVQVEFLPPWQNNNMRDAARIGDAITKAESEIAALEQRHLGPEELQRAIVPSIAEFKKADR